MAQRETIETAYTECSALSVEPQWNLIVKSNGDETLGWSSSYWTNSVLLNEQSPVAEAGSAKYAAFNDAPFTQIRLCIDTPEDNCFEHTVASRYTSAQSLFSAGYIADDTLDRDADLVDARGPHHWSTGGQSSRAHLSRYGKRPSDMGLWSISVRVDYSGDF